MMPECHPAAEYVKLFPSDDIPMILQNVINGCKTLKRQSPNENENRLSSRLFCKLISYPEYRIGPLTVVPLWESPLVRFSQDNAEITGRADILFLSPGGGLETYFLLEAKRLFVTPPNGKISSLTKKYIDEGMMRFVTNQYSSKMNAGAMLGYVFDKSVDTAKAALSIAINKKRKDLKMTADGDWQESSLTVSPPVDETIHALDQGAFTVYHILTQI